MICEGQGIPLAVTLTAANRNDITELLALVDRVPPTGRYGKFRPKALLADRAYDSRRHRAALRERGITPRVAKRKSVHGSGLGKDRWVIERTIAWLHSNRRLDRRYNRRDDIHEAFLTIGCAQLFSCVFYARRALLATTVTVCTEVLVYLSWPSIASTFAPGPYRPLLLESVAQVSVRQVLPLADLTGRSSKGERNAVKRRGLS